MKQEKEQLYIANKDISTPSHYFPKGTNKTKEEWLSSIPHYLDHINWDDWFDISSTLEYISEINSKILELEQKINSAVERRDELIYLHNKN